MWDINFVAEMLSDKQDQLADKDEFIRESDFSRDLRQAVLSRQYLVKRISLLEEIRDQMVKCNNLADMNEYIDQKALVYTLIQAYKEEAS